MFPRGEINRDLDEPVDGPRVFLSATLSKAIGGHGGVIGGSPAFLDRVRRSSGWFRGASARPRRSPPPRPRGWSSSRPIRRYDNDWTTMSRLCERRLRRWACRSNRARRRSSA